MSNAPHSPLDADVEALAEIRKRWEVRAWPSIGYFVHGQAFDNIHTLLDRVDRLEREARGFSGPLGEVPSTARRK